MLFFHPALIDDPSPAEVARAQVRRLAVEPRAVPAWNGLRLLAQSSAGPSFGIGSSAGPVGGTINPYTAVPAGSATSTVAPEATSRSTGSDSAGGLLGTQQEQGGGPGAGTSGAASPSSSGVTTTHAPVPAAGNGLGHPGPGASDGSALGPGGNRGGRLMETGDSIKTAPPPSLTNGRSAPKGGGDVAPKPRPAPNPSLSPATKPAATETTPPPPPPVETGIGSTR